MNALKKPNTEIEKEIFDELSTGESNFPWFKNIEKVKVTRKNEGFLFTSENVYDKF